MTVTIVLDFFLLAFWNPEVFCLGIALLASEVQYLRSVVVHACGLSCSGVELGGG
jgi:hypothetical protein